jgi:cation diffusion facilitator family transporter
MKAAQMAADRLDRRLRADQEARRVLVVVLGLNFVVAAAKIFYGVTSRSVAIRADGIHSLFDCGSNIVGLVGLWVATRPPDAGHPYGHRKFESMAALLIGYGVLLGLMEVLRSLIDAVRSGSTPEIDALGFVIAGGTLAINLGVSRYERRAGRRLDSEVLIADSRHTLGDSFATMGVLAGFMGVRLGYSSADLIAAVIVTFLIGLTAYQIFRRSFHSLLDVVELDPRQVIETAMGVAGVLDCHAVRSRAAAGITHVDLHIHVDPDMSVADAHDLTHEVEAAIRRRFRAVGDVIIHTEPVGAGPP